jgi:hypothetical protein
MSIFYYDEKALTVTGPVAVHMKVIITLINEVFLLSFWFLPCLLVVRFVSLVRDNHLERGGDRLLSVKFLKTTATKASTLTNNH